MVRGLKKDLKKRDKMAFRGKLTTMKKYESLKIYEEDYRLVEKEHFKTDIPRIVIISKAIKKYFGKKVTANGKSKN